MPFVAICHCLQNMASFSSDVSFVSDNVDESDSLKLVCMKKSCGKGMGGRMSSVKKRRQLLAASARGKRKLISSPVRNAGEDAAMPVAAVTSTSLPIAVTECGTSDSVTADTSDATIVKETAAMPSSASRSRTKLALMRDDSRPISVADGKLDVYFLVLVIV